MIKRCLLIVLLSGCSAIYQTPELKVAKTTEEAIADPSSVVVRELEPSILKHLNDVPFHRAVVDGRDLKGAAALKSVSGSIRNNPPPAGRPVLYRIGVGDVIQLSTVTKAGGAALIAATGSDNSGALGPTGPLSPNVSPVSENGTVSFIETGTLLLAGKTLTAAREVVLNALLRNSYDARFGLQITGFNAHRVILNVMSDGTVREDGSEGGSQSLVLPFTTTRMTLLELLARGQVSLPPSGDMRVRVQRGSKSYEMALSKVYGASAPNYYLAPGDRVTVEPLIFRPSRAFVYGGLDTPRIIPISPLRRDTLADALLTKGGVLNSSRANLDHVYLIRGRAPAVAYHLEVSNPLRLQLAARVELRPDDVVFVTEHPLVSWNRILAMLNPTIQAQQPFTGFPDNSISSSSSANRESN